MIKMNYAEHSGKGVEDYEPNIGAKVCKTTLKKYGNPKPFRSMSKVNTVKGVIMHPTMNIPAYTFVEDDSYVECRRCYIVEDNPDTNVAIGLNLTILKNSAGVDRYTRHTLMRLIFSGMTSILTENGKSYIFLLNDPTQKIAEIGDIFELKPVE